MKPNWLHNKPQRPKLDASQMQVADVVMREIPKLESLSRRKLASLVLVLACGIEMKDAEACLAGTRRQLLATRGIDLDLSGLPPKI